MLETRVALVGLGDMGAKHARKLVEMGGMEPAVIFRKRTKPPENRIKYAETDEAASKIFHRQVPIFDDVDACLAKFKPKIAIVASPTDAHFEPARKFLMAQVPVLVEKPLTFSIQQDTELVQLAQARETPLIVGWIERFNPAVRMLLDSDMVRGLGDIKRIVSTRSFKSEKKEHPLVNLGSHDMDVALRLLGQNDGIKFVRSEQEESGGKVVRATAFVNFSSGATVEATVVYTAETNRKMTITGQSGEATIDFAAKTIAMTGSRGGKFESHADQLIEELYFFLMVAKKENRHNDPWLFDPGTQAVSIMMSAAATRVLEAPKPTARPLASSQGPQSLPLHGSPG